MSNAELRIATNEFVECWTCYGEGYLFGEDDEDMITCSMCVGVGLVEMETIFFDNVEEVNKYDYTY